MINQPAHPVVELSNLTYRYSASSPIVLSIQDLALQPNEQLVITGQSGCGKSTLLHLLAGLMDPNTGSIQIKGTNIHRLRSSKRDRFRGHNIGMVFQTHHLLHGFTVLENILAALMFSDMKRSTHRPRAMSLLETLGINTPDARIEDLSIGQQQRVAVARAVACSPAVVLADEPTSALDPEFASSAMDMLQGVCRANNAALICVTHDASLIHRFDRHEKLEDLALAKAQNQGEA